MRGKRHVDELQAERVEILDELETLNDRLAQVCRESESIRNFYIDQLGEVPAAVSVRVEARSRRKPSRRSKPTR